MNIETLSLVAGALLSLLFNYIPGLNTWFDRQSPNTKRLTMAGILAIAAVGISFWGCTDPTREESLTVCLGTTNWRAVITAYIASIMANQGTDRISPKPSESRKASRKSSK